MKYIASLFILFNLSLFSQTNKKYELITDSLIELGKPEEAIAFLKKELKTNSDKENLYRAIGNTNFLIQKNSEGRKYYRLALKINPNCANCYANMARSFLIDSLEKAKEYIDKAIMISDTLDYYFTIRGSYFASQGKYFDALLDYKKAIEIRPSAENYFYRARLNISYNYFSLALDDCNKAIGIEPEFMDAYQLRAEIYYDLKKYEFALNDLNAAIFLDSANAVLYNQKGVILDLLSNKSEALKCYSQSIQLDNTSYETYHNRSMIYYDLEDMDNTCIDLSSAYNLMEQQKSNNSLKESISNQMKDICDSSKASYYYQRGIAQYNLGNYSQAIHWYRRSLSKFPNDAMTISFIGNAYMANKDYENALAVYENALAENTFYKSLKNNVRFNTAPLDSIELMRKSFVSTTYFSMAEAHLGLNHFNDAEIAMQKALDSLPNKGILGAEKFIAGYYNLRGNIYLAQQKYELSLADFDYAIRLNSQYSHAYVNRAITKINQVEKITMSTVFLSHKIGNQTLAGAWTFPLNKNSISSNNALLVSALNDCNTAIAMDKNLGYAYYTSGHIKKMMMKDYCDDFIRASELGFPVEQGILTNCGR